MNEAARAEIRWEPDGQMLQLTAAGVEAWRCGTQLQEKHQEGLEMQIL